MKTKENYIALLKDLDKHKELLEEDYDLYSLSTIKDKIFTRELIEDYGWEMQDHIIGNTEWFRISDELSAGSFGKGTRRTISWEDDGKDPNGEFLLCIGYSSGAYFFGGDYDTELFKVFFKELETYNPKFKDSRNHCLYFTKETAGILMKNYFGIVRKYRDIYNREADKRKAKKLREELLKLESAQ